MGVCQGSERTLVTCFLVLEQRGFSDARIGSKPSDTFVTEMPFRLGRADVVIFHTDGSATVVEAKNGLHGYAHVVAGIGQASLYAAQLAATRGAVTRVRKALMWTSVGNPSADAAIEDACFSAGTIPLPWPGMPSLMEASGIAAAYQSAALAAQVAT